MFTLQAGKQHGVGFRMLAFGEYADDETASTMKARDYKDATDLAVTVSLRGREGGATAELGGDVAGTLRASSGGGDKPHVLTSLKPVSVHGTQDPCVSDKAFELGRNNGQENVLFEPPMKVRRLTPRECERLQGFPDNHTNVTYRGKPAADGPRYKAIGNSMAVPVMHWVGNRIDRERTA
ncbi:DNA cytosine methyltransferase [Marinobacterium litorale]|uniref:DNA cytosine methyltransferase n=1 Tax=Marinobacterium litorale TaxID=404770 RepID=UPI00068728B6|nr:DNA cytosine methyltransferase [Marinobacterium litorale]